MWLRDCSEPGAGLEPSPGFARGKTNGHGLLQGEGVDEVPWMMQKKRMR